MTPASSGLSSRFYQTEQDLRDTRAMLMQARSQTDDWRYAHVGELDWSFYMVDCHLDPRRHIRLWHSAAGMLVGYAILGEDPAFDWQVLPEFEWCGIEIEAMQWAEQLVTQLRHSDPGRWGGPMVCGARQDNPQRRIFLEKNCFRLGGEFSEVNMLRSLDDPLPDFPVPPGCHVRAVMETGETAGRAAAQRDVWQPWSVGDVTSEDYARFMRLPGYDRQLDVIAVAPDGAIAAYVNGWADPVNCIGDLGPVGARPAYRRQGYARAVLLECLQRMRALGMDRVCVSTGVSNTPAQRLYESIGFEVVNRYLEYVRMEPA